MLAKNSIKHKNYFFVGFYNGVYLLFIHAIHVYHDTSMLEKKPKSPNSRQYHEEKIQVNNRCYFLKKSHDVCLYFLHAIHLNKFAKILSNHIRDKFYQTKTF